MVFADCWSEMKIKHDSREINIHFLPTHDTPADRFNNTETPSRSRNNIVETTPHSVDEVLLRNPIVGEELIINKIHYRVVRLLGRGGGGTVFEVCTVANDRNINCPTISGATSTTMITNDPERLPNTKHFALKLQRAASTRMLKGMKSEIHMLERFSSSYRSAGKMAMGENSRNMDENPNNMDIDNSNSGCSATANNINNKNVDEDRCGFFWGEDY